MTPVERRDWHVGMPKKGKWREALNTDSATYGGGDRGNMGRVTADGDGWHGQPYSARVTVPPLSAVYLVEER